MTIERAHSDTQGGGLDMEETSGVLFDDLNLNSDLDNKLFHSVEKRATGEDEFEVIDKMDTASKKRKRSAFKYKYLKEMSSPKTVEVLVVVDKNMYHNHGDANITTYTLTLFNMVSLNRLYNFYK